MVMGSGSQRLNGCALGFALGIIWGGSMLMLGWLGWLAQFGVPVVHAISSVYLGFAPTFLGGIIGALWGAADFFIFGVLIAWLYNLCLCCSKCCAKSCISDDTSDNQQD